MATQKINTTVLPAGPTKRVWVNKHVLPQFGGTSPTAPVWEVECEGVRYSGMWVALQGYTITHYNPNLGPEGPHAWVETRARVIIKNNTAAEEAA